MISDENSVQIVAFPERVRAGRGPDYDEGTKAVLLYIYATSGNRSPALTAKQAAKHFPPGTRLPDMKTIWQWAATEDWRSRADDIWRAYPGRVLSELQHLHVAAALVSAQRMLDVVSGEDTRPVDERLIVLKAYELVFKTLVNLPQLARVTPEERAGMEGEELPRDEREALARKAIVRPKSGKRPQGGQGYPPDLLEDVR
jgi:hypothetical protein